jgi:tRNA(fMet)-specific endonuclease VapC
MSFLLDTDTCSGSIKNNPTATRKIMLHFGGLRVSAVTQGELLTWALRRSAPADREQVVRDFLNGCTVLEITEQIADTFGRVRATLLDRGITVAPMDLFNAATALVYNLTLVTHNTRDYQHIPGLTLDDWS